MIVFVRPSFQRDSVLVFSASNSRHEPLLLVICDEETAAQKMLRNVVLGALLLCSERGVCVTEFHACVGVCMHVHTHVRKCIA